MLWQQFLPNQAPEHWYSLPELVHRDREGLRSAYLAWVHEAGMHERRARSLRERLLIRPGLSYWWMTIPADFSLEPNSPVYIAVRLMALVQLVDELGIEELVLAGTEHRLESALGPWANSKGVRIHRLEQQPEQAGPRARSLPTRIRTAIYRAVPPVEALRVLLAHASVPKRRTPATASPGGITMVDYLAHLGPNARSGGAFDSNYWGPLVPVLAAMDPPVNWLHISAEQASSSVLAADRERIAGFNTAAPQHALLHDKLSWGVLARSCREYVRIAAHGLRNGGGDALTEQSTGIDLRPIFRHSWRDQFYGRTAMLNSLWINLFEKEMSELPHQRLGIYLCENQPWEMAFIHAWRSAGHGRLVGVAHSTALFWSTRMFKDPRDEWTSDEAAAMPWPDQIAVNGPMMRATCRAAGYPLERMVDVEALRYFELMTGDRALATPPLPTVLVFGEYLPEASQHLLALVSETLNLTSNSMLVKFRPHPAHIGQPLQLDPRITLDTSAGPAAALNEAAITICGVHSSIAVESACRGRITLVVSDPALLTSSPAEAMSQTVLVSSARELARAIDHAIDLRNSDDGQQQVFAIDEALPRWHSIID